VKFREKDWRLVLQRMGPGVPNPSADHIIRVAAYAIPLSWEDRDMVIDGHSFNRVLRVSLCPNRREFAHRFTCTVKWDDWPYGPPGETYTLGSEDLCVFIDKDDIRRFVCRAMLYGADDVFIDKKGKRDVNPTHQWNDYFELLQEPPTEGGKGIIQEGTATAPLFATFTAHFAEGSKYVDVYQRDSSGNGLPPRCKMAMPITDGNEVWFGRRL